MAAPKQGGFKMSLGGLKSKINLKAAVGQKEVKRPRLALGDDEQDDSNKQQEISGWDAAEGGAVDVAGKKEKEAPRVIPALPNRSWRDEARKVQLAKAPHTQAQNQINPDDIKEPEAQFGLIISKQATPPQDETTEPEPMVIEKDELTEEQRLDKKALDALLSGKTTDEDFVIPVKSEEEALHDDLVDAPEAPTLATYEATPIEGFGAALLRGMGWKDGDTLGRNGPAPKAQVVKRRPALLGIGAKAAAATGEELGEWVSKSRGKKAAENYTPLTLRNKVTGEIITEEELKTKLEQQKMVPDEKSSREKEKKKYYEDDERDDRRRDKQRDRRDDYSYDKERRREKDSRRDRDSDHYDSERRSDKRKDRYRDEEYDSERRRDRRKDRDRRERTRSPEDDKRDKRRDRYRSRSRDSKRDRDRRERSPESDERRKRRREKEYDYDDRRDDKKRRGRDDGYYK